MNAVEPFRQALLTVQGQALEAAGYCLQANPLQWNAGLLRFVRATPQHLLIVDYQLLVHPAHPARFQPRLARDPGTDAISLPRLVWDVFGVHVLPDADYWWRYEDASALAEALLEAGKLLVGYGLPWLDGSLQPRS